MRESLKLQSKKRLFAKLQGEHNSIFGGSGKEFLELKEYSSSDSARHINWKRSTQTQNPLVNVYGDERELNIVVVYLVSGSLLFDSKQNIARDVTAVLSFSASSAKERLNLLFFSNRELKFLPNILDSGFDIAYDLAQEIKHKGEFVEYQALSDFLLSTLKERSIIFLIGDFLEPNIDLSQLNSIHELYLVQIRSKKEEQLSLFGDRTLFDAIKQKSRNFFITKSVANSYNQAFLKQYELLKNYLLKEQIEFTKVYKDSNILEELQKLMRVV